MEGGKTRGTGWVLNMDISAPPVLVVIEKRQ